MKVELGHPEPDRPDDVQIRNLRRWDPPLLAELHPEAIRRWKDLATWMPPETSVLCRHRRLGGEERVHATERLPPPGYMIEFDLGCVHRHALPGVNRLLEVAGSFQIDPNEEELSPGAKVLGFVEQAPFAMLETLELRMLVETGQHVLVAGAEDPLIDRTTPIAQLGWIESFPIAPRRIEVPAGAWGLRTLVRTQDAGRWRHTYTVDPPRPATGAVRLGGLWHREGPGFTPLVELADGRLRSGLLEPGPPGRVSTEALRWVAAPLGWARRPRGSAARATASRARHLARAPSVSAEAAGGAPLGWLRRTPAPGWSPLFSASHPALPDQFVGRSELEANDLGFRIDGVLGYICDVGADHPAGDPDEVLWGSRFGRGRRTFEGRIADLADGAAGDVD